MSVHVMMSQASRTDVAGTKLSTWQLDSWTCGRLGVTESVSLRGLSLLLYPGTMDVFTDMLEESNTDIVPEFDCSVPDGITQ